MPWPAVGNVAVAPVVGNVARAVGSAAGVPAGGVGTAAAATVLAESEHVAVQTAAGECAMAAAAAGVGVAVAMCEVEKVPSGVSLAAEAVGAQRERTACLAAAVGARGTSS